MNTMTRKALQRLRSWTLNVAVFALVSAVAYHLIGLQSYAPGATPPRHFFVVLEPQGMPTAPVAVGWLELDEGRPKDDRYSLIPSKVHGHFSPASPEAGPVVVSYQQKKTPQGVEIKVRHDGEDYRFTSTYRVVDGAAQPVSLHTGHGMTGLVALLAGLAGVMLMRVGFALARRWRAAAVRQSAGAAASAP